MKILFISPSPVWGGASTANLSIAKVFAKLGWSVTYIDEYMSTDNYEGIEICHLPVHKNKFRLSFLIDYVKKNKFDHIFWGNYMLTLYYAPVIFLLKHKGVIQYSILHSVRLSNSLKSKIFDLSFASIAKKFDRIICVSNYTVNCWKTINGFKRAMDSVRIIHNSIDYPDSYVKKEHSGVNVGFVGRFSEEKQPDVFCALSESSSYHFVAWGDGPLLEALKRRYPLVEFKGQGLDTNSMYSNMDVLVMTSKFENCPMVVLEAMVRGIPCVCPRVGGIPEILENGVEGILYDNYSSDVIIEGIKFVLKDYGRYSDNCIKKAKTFLLEPTSHKWKAIII